MIKTASPSPSSPYPLRDFPHKGKKAENSEFGGDVPLGLREEIL